MTIAKPTQVATPFANSGLKNSIPQSATGSNLASLEEGFPAVTMTAVGDGGEPPQGQDFNGILNQVTSQLRYAQAGGLYPYDSTFCAAIGGYPLGAILMSADGSKLWQNQVAGNANDPDSDDTNWTELCTVDALTAGLATKQGTLTFDSTPTANSSNPVTSGGIKTALDGKQDILEFDDAPTEGSTNPVTSGGVKTALDAKQDSLTFDSTPTANSSNPVTSDGIKTALDGKLDTSGGTMTGNVAFNKTGALITRYGVNSIFGIDETKNQIYVASADGTKYLRLGDGGELLWAGKEVERVDSLDIGAGSGWIRYESGLQICGGYANSLTDKADTRITFPKAFTVAPAVVMSRSSAASTTSDVAVWKRGSPTTTYFNVYATGATNMTYIAFGRWK